MLRWRRFIIEDAEQLRTVAIEGVRRDEKDMWREMSKTYLENGPAYTGLVGDEIIMSVGIHLIKRDYNIGIAWAVFSPLLRRNKKTALRAMRILINNLIEEFRLKEVWTVSRKGFAASQTLLKHLGFIPSGMGTETEYYYVLRM